MSDMVNIILTGRVRRDFERADVVAALAEILKISDAEADGLLSEQETVLKQDVPREIASRHIRILRDIGVKARARARAGATAPAVVEPVLPVMGNNPKSSPESNDVLSPHDRKRLHLELVPIDEPKPVLAADTWAQTKPIVSRTSYAGGHGLENRSRRASARAPSLFSLSLNGRLGRLRYLVYGWLGILLVAVGALLLLTMMGVSLRKFAMQGAANGLVLAGTAAIGLMVLWMSIRVAVLRLHDINRSGIWVVFAWLLPGFVAGLFRSPDLLAFAAVISWIGFFALLLWPGSPAENDYGAPPGENTLPVYLGTLSIILLSLTAAHSYYRHSLPQVEQLALRSAADSRD